NDKEKAEMIFSTVHRCKGMEYDCVQLADDFITEEKIKQTVEKDNSGSFNAAKLNEEVNLLYVAVTRAKNCIYIPETLIPKGFPGSPQIHLLNVVGEEVKVQGRKTAATGSSEIKGVNNEKSYTVGQFRDRHKAANSPWTPELDDELTIMFCEGVSIKEMAKHFGRTRGAIALRIRKLELEDLYG
ncbi:MAG TPA: 3'-5' exonuclease, partial [Agriterribacter sp.]|nr:3'-5' exonuclease [Agriterribacter sp.]